MWCLTCCMHPLRYAWHHFKNQNNRTVTSDARDPVTSANRNVQVAFARTLKSDNHLLNRNRLLKHATRLQVRFQQTACQVCLCLPMHPARYAVCKSYNEKTGEASNTVAVLPFISALHNFILPVICARTCLKSYSTHPTSLFGPFCAHPLTVACGEGRSCDVRMCVYVCLGVRGLLVTHRY